MSVDRAISEAMDKAIAIFRPVFEDCYRSSAPEYSLFKDISDYKICFIDDVRDVGMRLSHADNVGKRLELGVLADTIAYIELAGSKGNIFSSADEALENRADAIFEELQKLSEGYSSSYDILLPKSVQICQCYDTLHGTRNAPDLQEQFLAFINMFILQDGNVTDQELTFVKLYQDLFETQPRYLSEV